MYGKEDAWSDSMLEDASMRFAAIVFTALVLALSASSQEKPNLTGKVIDENEAPYAGATVSIYSARPKAGAGVVCPTCYADCTKRAATDASGLFTIPSLDPALLFRVLVTAENYSPLSLDNIDPAEGPVTAKLVELDPARMEPGHVVRGRVLDPRGKPVAGAKIEPFAIHKGNSTQYGGLNGIDAMAISNEKGEFAITSDRQDLSVGILIDAAGLARRIFMHLDAMETTHKLSMTYGATVAGAVLLDKKPVPGLFIGLAQTDRACASFVGEWVVQTNKEGRFEFPNIAPNCECVLYSKIDSPGLAGAIPEKIVAIGADDTILDLGVLEAVPGHTLSGRVVLSDGKSVPPGTCIRITREQAWDWKLVPVDEQGAFEAHNLPPELYEVSCTISDYHMSEQNQSLDPFDRARLIGMLSEDVADLTLLMEPGELEKRGRVSGDTQRRTQLKSEPIRGANAKE